MKQIKIIIKGDDLNINVERTFKRGQGITFLKQMKRIKDNYIKVKYPKDLFPDWMIQQKASLIKLVVTINEIKE